MKIRQGFVSNSSSSSFCIYGVNFEYSDILDAIKLKKAEACCQCGKPKIDDDEHDGSCSSSKLIEEFVENNIGNNDLVYHNISDWDQVYIGKSPRDMDLDETRRQFQEKITENVKKIFKEKLNIDVPDNKFEIHEETYNC